MMTLNLTLARAQEIIRQHLNLPNEVKVVISRKQKVSFNDLRPEVSALIKAVEKGDYRSGQLGFIPAIKEYRAATNSGLAQAKWAVENWNQVKFWMVKYNKLPVVMGNPYSTGFSLA